MSPFVAPTDLPMTPPQSLPPTPPSSLYTHYTYRPSLSQRANPHAFPSTPSVSYCGAFTGTVGERSVEGEDQGEQSFRFPVPEGHLSPAELAEEAEADLTHVGKDAEERAAIVVGKRCVSPVATASSGSRAKGAFQKAFLMGLPSVIASPPPLASANGTHGRSAPLSSSRADAMSWRTHGPSESILGLGAVPAKTSGKRRRKGDDDGSSWPEEDRRMAPLWSYRTALLPLLSRRWRRVLAFCLLVLFVMVFVKSLRPQDSTDLVALRQRLHKTSSFAVKARPPAGTTVFEREGLLAGSAGLAELGGWDWKEGEELAALIGFLTSEDTHAIPPMVSGKRIDPELVLDFDPLHSTNLARDMREMVDSVWRERPCVLLGKGHGDLRTRDLRNTLNGLRMQPAPSVLHVDTRADTDQIVPVLERLTGQALDDFPVLFVGGRQVEAEHWSAEELRERTAAAGVSFIKPKTKRPVPAANRE